MEERVDAVHTNRVDNFTKEEIILSNRNHGMHLEGLKYDITPTGMHYLLIHFDIPKVDPQTYRLKVKGLVDRELIFSLDELKAMPSLSLPVTMECAGNGRINMANRFWTHVPWNLEAIGTSVWKGVPLHRILAKAGLKSTAVELLFTGLDKGVQGKEVQYFQRSLTIAEATADEVILAYEMNGAPLLPQHGSPLRLIVPGWYGMTNVKWLDSIEAIDYNFDGHQMKAYSYIGHHDEKVTRAKRVKHLKVRALMAPPGIPDFFVRSRLVEEAPVVRIEGRAWAGPIGIASVEVSLDGGRSWASAELDEPVGKFAWTHWSFDWKNAKPGTYKISCKATDADGHNQDPNDTFNYFAMGDTQYHMVEVQVLTKEELREKSLLEGPEPDLHRSNL